ncbi:MAG: gamma-glutamyltransferase family protein [Rhodocyclaceae bacterium]|jgi:gamma-glutamyltranspeptidase/glutathione hydrolase|nr:gamma-glutamyltransferase family protein [Rhodocyclaceae bacterium]MCL4679783.1 gamma-glutamyltransferase family protein [Rhodocyclaceae bacterium]
MEMHKLIGILLAALWAGLAANAFAEAPSQPEAASGVTAVKEARGRLFMAVTANLLATDAAVEILRAGGTAADAAIAAQLVLNLVEPQSSGLGGGGFLLYHDARENRLRAYDGRETAPKAARPERFLGSDGKPLPFFEAVVGGRSVGVPGLPALLDLVYRNHGRMLWPKLFGPALRLAVEGFPMSPRLHKLLAEDRYLREDSAARRLYYETDGRPKSVGTRIVNRAYGFALLALAQHGTKIFYEGPIARDISAAVRAHPKNPGDLSEPDLAGYKPVEREPVCGERLGGYRVCGMPPPSSGGIAVLQMLTFAEPVSQQAPLAPETVHRFAESGRLTFADRARYLADPAFVDIPVKALLDPAYLAARAQLIRAEASMGRAAAGELSAKQSLGEDAPAELPATTHLSIVDAEGSAVAMTSSVEAAFGSRIMVHGFLLNNQLTDFSFRPEMDGKPVANRVEAGKRPLSSMAPTILYDKAGHVAAILGSPGGSQIINYVAKTILALLAWNLTPAEAVALPHYGSRNGPTELERGTQAEQLRPALERLGHTVSVQDMTSGLSVILRRGDDWIGAADPRREGAARGE